MSETDEQERPRKCFVCGKPRLEPEQRQTCTPCLGRTREWLHESERLYALLPAAVSAGNAGSLAGGQSRNAESPVLGGDALVMLAPGSTGSAAALASLHRLDDSHAADDLSTDPPAVLAELASWEDDWHEVRTEAGIDETPLARPATLMQTVTYLTRRLGWAAQEHDAFDEFHRDLRRIVGRLRSVTRDGYSYDYGAIGCPSCGGELFRDIYDPARCKHDGPHCDHSSPYSDRWPCRGERGCRCDQGGRRDGWKCRNRECGRTMKAAEYWLLVRHEHEEQQRKREECEECEECES